MRHLPRFRSVRPNESSRTAFLRGAERRLFVERLEDRRLLAVLNLPAVAAAELEYDHADSRILVQFDNTVGDAEAARRGASQRVGNTDWWTVPTRPGQGAADALSSFRTMAGVAHAQLDYRVQAAAIAPNDSLFEQGCLWGLHNSGQAVCGFSSGTADADIDADLAWDITTGDPNVVVAVIDTGVDYTHPDLEDNIWVNTAETLNGIDDDGNGYVDDIRGWNFVNGNNNPSDNNGHGTHVAGTIAAAGNNQPGLESGQGMAGVAWNVKIMPLKFLDANGNGYTSHAIAALDYAVKKGVRISNNSWGGAPSDAALYQAIQNAGIAGHLFVTASGNGDFRGRAQNNDSKPVYPASYNLDNIITVTASDRSDRYSSFGNYGATSVDIAAPGVAIWSTIPFSRDTVDFSVDGYSRFDGTSMATPHVAGTAALMLSVNPTLTHQEMKQWILSTGDSILNTQRPTVTNDRLNTFNAVSAARDLVPNDPPVAGDDAYEIVEDGILSVAALEGVLANDSDPDGGPDTPPLTAVLVSNAANGNATLNSDGSFSYTPVANFFGSDSFTYRAHDGVKSSNVATVSITVTGVDDPPVAAADSYSVQAGALLSVAEPGVLANDSDPDGDAIFAEWVSGPTNGQLTIQTDGSFTYIPNAGFVGSDSFTYLASDGQSNSNVATVNITVLPAETVLFADSFTSLSKWVNDGQNDWFLSSQRFTDGTTSVEVDGSANNAALTMRDPISLVGYQSATLTFSWFIDSSWDKNEYIALDIRKDSGSWLEVRRLRANVDPEGVWQDVSVDLASYLGSSITVRFRAKVSDPTEVGNVDNLRVVGISDTSGLMAPSFWDSSNTGSLGSRGPQSPGAGTGSSKPSQDAPAPAVGLSPSSNSVDQVLSPRSGRADDVGPLWEVLDDDLLDELAWN